ncbi:MAG: M48 family metallopeptidase [Acidobacteria bacterium]|nr:M48 family metallopeptidase [Acidobacteriota bacterium]
MQRSALIRSMAVLLSLMLVAPPPLEARYKPKYGWNLFSREQEVQVGKETSAESEKQLPILKDSDPVSRYIQRLGKDLAAHAPPPEYPYTFKVVNQKEINAFALPGGPVYINLGTIQAAQNESELAGVIGHEISHVVMRHATEQATKQTLATAPLAILGGRLGGSLGGQLAQLGISFGLNSVFLKYSRNDETEADLVGAGILHDAGYNPRGMVSFFETLSAESGGKSRGPQFLASHPNPGNRAQKVAQEVATLPATRYRGDSAEFREVKRLAANMKPLTAKEIAEHQKQQGGEVQEVTLRDILPSDEFTRFEHQQYRVSYPANWKVFGDKSSAVTIAPSAGVAENAVAYGVMIAGFTPESRRASLDDATHQLLQQIRQGNPEHKVVGHDEDIRVNRVPGKSVMLVGPSPIKGSGGRPLRERDWLVTLRHSDGSIVWVLFIAPERDFSQFETAFERMLRSLRLQ